MSALLQPETRRTRTGTSGGDKTTKWIPVRRAQAWLREEAFSRMLVNAGWLLGANGLSAVFLTAATLLSARALGAAQYGLLALTLSYVAVAGRLMTFQPWQAFVKFGSDCLAANDRQGLRRLIAFGWTLDATGSLAGFLLAYCAAAPLTRALGWDPSAAGLIRLYSLALPAAWRGTPIGVLRLFNRFDLFGYAQAVRGAAILVGTAVCAFFGGDAAAFALAYLAGAVTGELALIAAGRYVLRRQRLSGSDWLRLPRLSGRFPGIWDFAWTTNFSTTIRLLAKEVDILVVASVAGPAAVGVYRLAKQAGRVMILPLDPLHHSVYPELARLWSRCDRRGFLRVLRRSTLLAAALAGSCWLLFAAAGRPMIRILAGREFGAAYGIGLLYLLALAVLFLSFALQPALAAMGRPRETFKAHLFSAVLYVSILVPALRALGIAGAPTALLAYYFVWAGVMCLLFRRAWRTAETLAAGKPA